MKDIIDFGTKRKEKSIEIALKVISLSDKVKQRAYLPFNIDLIVDSAEAMRKEKHNILMALAQHKPHHWDFTFSEQEANEYFSSDERFNCTLGRDGQGNIIWNKQAYPMGWIIYDLEKRGYLESLNEYILSFSKKGIASVRIYGSVDKHNCIDQKCNTLTDSLMGKYPYLLSDIHNEGFDSAIRVMYPEIYNFILGVPILQDGFRGIKNESGFLVMCTGSDSDGGFVDLSKTDDETYDGVLYKPHDFAKLHLDDIVLSNNRIIERCNQQKG